MENSIIHKIKLMMVYDSGKTLTENKESLDYSLIEEQWRTAIETSNIMAKELEGSLKILKADAKISSELTKLGIKTSDDLLKMIKLNKLTGEIKGALDSAILRSATTNKVLIDTAVSNLVKNKTFTQKYANEIAKGQVELEKALKSSGKYSENAISSIVNQVEGGAKSAETIAKDSGRLKDLKGSSPEIKQYVKNVPDVKDAVKNVEKLAVDATQAGLNPSTFQKIGNIIGFYGAAGFSRIISLASKMSFKKLVLYGLAGYGAYTVLNNLFGDDPNPSVLDPCVVNSDKVELLPTTSGDIMGFVKETDNEEYDKMGGLKLYSNGRVLTGDLSKRGKYSCSTGGLKLGESTKKKKLNEETILGNIEINWDVPGGGNESSSTESSTGSFKRECGDPYSRGCKETDPNGPLHKVQGCIGVKSDGLFGGKTEAALLSKTQSKSFMAKDVDKICSSSGSGGQQVQDDEYTIDTENQEAGETDTEGV